MASAPETLLPTERDVPAPPGAGTGSSAAPGRYALLAGLCGLVAIVCGVLLPFAPVVVSEPSVSWPRDPARPEASLLTLAAYRPLAIDASFSCRAVRAVDRSGLVLATVEPTQPSPEAIGLVVRAEGGQLDFRGLGRSLLVDPVPSSDCSYRIIGTASGIAVSRDGQQLALIPTSRLPDVDLLATSVALPGATRDDLDVTIRVDDEFASSPASIKIVLIALTLAGVAGAGWFLFLMDRASSQSRRRWRLVRPRVVDLLVPAVLVFWLFIAPATDDDGYYAAMARNSALTDFVGNYYQFYNQSFTPFTWFYQVLGWYQETVGFAPVMQRLPALLVGLLTWLVLRRIVGLAMRDWEPSRTRLHSAAAVVLAITFLAWWLPQVMGVRPEGVVALCSSIALLGVFTAARNERLAPAWLAFAAAGLGFAVHPTGFTTLAPLIAGAPALWRLMRSSVGRWGFVARLAAVISGGVTASVVAFWDGAFRDFVRGQAIFLSLQSQESWSTEYLRYWFLLIDNPMGSYAKRVAVLLALVALAWFVVLVVAARARQVQVPAALTLTGWSMGLCFLLLWLTPSKWTHHFGALSGIGAVFLTLLLVMSVGLVRQLSRDGRLPYPVVIAIGGSVVVALALAGRGPNSWPYAWLFGVRAPDVPPAIYGVRFGSPVVWLVVLLAAGLAVLAWQRRRGRPDVRTAALPAVALLVVLALAANICYLVGTFAMASQQPVWSTWAANLRDPAATDCVAGGAVQVTDPRTARPLPALPGQPDPGGSAGQVFRPGVGFYAAPPIPASNGAVTETWGSLLGTNGAPPELANGQLTTGWYQLPGGTPDAALGVLAAGSLTAGNTLTAEYGTTAGGDDIGVMGTQSLSDGVASTAWRTMELVPPPGADVVRLQGVDATGGTGGWLAFSAPSVQQWVALNEFLRAEQPVGLAWQIAFQFPCLRPPHIVDGITEPPAAGVMWGDKPLSGLVDGTWETGRGGIYGQVQRTQSTLALLARFPDQPNEKRIQVYLFGSPLATDAYKVTRTTRQQFGFATATG